MPQIVILDDRATNRKIFSKLAASIDSGVTVRSFGDPAEALAWLKHNTPDLIVTDFKMPVTIRSGVLCLSQARASAGSPKLRTVTPESIEAASFEKILRLVARTSRMTIWGMRQ